MPVSDTSFFHIGFGHLRGGFYNKIVEMLKT